ncbi:alpha/beta hydrolase family protein [Oceanobacter mangrovi]|uniref:alpha/beta hydrolase family protein n=1 Tax=Oceanobacter mangrovi TaxID=2862510 RepID=UPI001C8D549C|nr:alpha/beta fold hydrolase [Oceanobacter mangrovi]
MQVQFVTDDQVTLNGYWFDAENPQGAVLLNPGTATQTLFYKNFCEFLAVNRYQVLLWNYRGFCESRSGSLKDANYRYSDIGRFDIPAAIAAIKSRARADLPLFCIGHSAGGQQFGFASNAEDIKGLIAVASSAGYFPNMPLAYRLKALFFFRMFSPLSSALLGYVAASRFNLMEDLTSNLAREWNDWCSEPNLFFADRYYGKTIEKGHYENMPMPVHVISANDDEICTPANIDNFWKHVKSRQGISFSQYPAADSPSKKIGHFGYFKRSNSYIWEDILQQLESWRSSSS